MGNTLGQGEQEHACEKTDKGSMSKHGKQEKKWGTGMKIEERWLKTVWRWVKIVGKSKKIVRR